MRNLHEIFRKDVTYDNIKSHKKTGFHPLFSRYIFGKTTGESQTDPPVVLGLKCKFETFESWVKNSPNSSRVSSSSNFASFFSVMTHNFCVYFWLKHNIPSIKVAHESTNFQTSYCSH